MIKRFSITELIATQYIAYLERVIAIVNLSDPTKLKIVLRLNILIAYVARIEKVLKKEQALRETAELKVLEGERNAGIIGFTSFVNSYLRSTKPALVAASKLLFDYLQMLSTYIPREDSSTKSALLNKLYDDAQKKTDVKNAIAIIGAEDWIAQINNANKAFEAKYQARTIIISNEENEDTYSALRQPTKLAYDGLIGIINSRYDVALYENTDTKDLQDLINNINALVEQTEQIIKSTKPKKGKGKLTKAPPSNPIN